MTDRPRITKPFNAQHAAVYDDKAEDAGWVDPDIVFGLSFRHVVAGDSILDVGIGTGLSSTLFHKAGLEVHGVDASGDMLEVCRGKSFAVNLQQHDLSEVPYPFADASANHAVCTGVLHIFQDIDPIFSELARIMKRGGIFTFAVAHCEGEDARQVTMQGDEKHHRKVRMWQHPPSEVQRVSERHGFEQVSSLVFTGRSIGRREADFRACVVRLA